MWRPFFHRQILTKLVMPDNVLYAHQQEQIKACVGISNVGSWSIPECVRDTPSQ